VARLYTVTHTRPKVRTKARTLRTEQRWPRCQTWTLRHRRIVLSRSLWLTAAEVTKAREVAAVAAVAAVAVRAVRAARAVVGVGAVVADAAAVVSVAQLAAVVVTPLKVL
jgi:hypothetical protein